ncbi:FkbM family methyltransferase [Pseudochelatococcus sp. G4_1912]|uniref:FkbM family methyltransferase n=1 Tax=Pseudochelatococcus sp. G4_1912 TaxID=3114288 RepID=UPI0039C5FFB5
MLRRIQKLVSEPAFQEAPLTVLTRAAAWTGHLLAGKLGRPSPIFTLTAQGERLTVPSDMRYTSVATFLLRDWSEPELHELDLFVHPGDYVIDVGANIGLYTLKAARLAGPQGHVIAVEPGTAARTQLLANLALNPFKQVTVIGKALAEAEGEATLHHVALGDDPQAFSLIADTTTTEGETVATTTLDTLAAELALPRVDLIKIDVEGFEANVLAGARGTLMNWHPTVIFEINTDTLKRSGRPLDGAWKELEAQGYAFFKMEGRHFQPLTTMPDTFGNIIARHPARNAG